MWQAINRHQSEWFYIWSCFLVATDEWGWKQKRLLMKCLMDVQLGLWKFFPLWLKRWGFLPPPPPTFLGCQEPYCSLHEPLPDLFWFCQALYLLGWASCTALWLILKVISAKRERIVWWQGRDPDVMFSPYALVMFRDLWTRCWNSPVSSGVGARTRTELASKLSLVGHPLWHACCEPSLHRKEMEEEGVSTLPLG